MNEGQYMQEQQFVVIRKHPDGGYVMVEASTRSALFPRVDPAGEYQVFDTPFDAHEAATALYETPVLIHGECDDIIDRLRIASED